MDSFTESILSRARDRQRLIEGLSNGGRVNTTSVSQPNLNVRREVDVPPGTKNGTSASEGNVSKFTTTRVSSEFSGSPKSQPKLFNIQKDNFNMEIKVSSQDNVRVEVQIEEEQSSSDSDVGLREESKKRLDRLGKLYAGGDDADISSPIHRTEARFLAEPLEESKVTHRRPLKGLSKLADLAQNMNEWDDDYNRHKELEVNKKTTSVKRRRSKGRAPQPPSTPAPPKGISENIPVEESTASKVLKWDKKVLDSLESQGYTRTDSSAHLVYNYDKQKGKENVMVAEAKEAKEKKVEATEKDSKPRPISSPQKMKSAIADKAALFENASPKKGNDNNKDPALLSVSERKALFERNKGAALVPKAPFAMNIAPVVPTAPAAPVAKPLTPVLQTAAASSKRCAAPTPVKYAAPKPPTAAAAKPVESKRHKGDGDGGKVVAAAAPAAGIANTVAALFGAKSTISQEQIEAKVKGERQKEMEMLLNRFKKTDEVIEQADDEAETDSDSDNEEEGDEDVADEETAMLPEKTEAKAIVVAPPTQQQPTSSKKIISKMRKSDSPKVVEALSHVKRVKVSPRKAGRLYPSLTDIESQTESPASNSSYGSEANMEEPNTSLGRDILQTVCKNQESQKRALFNDSISSGLSDVLDDMDDDYIDEALAFDVSGGGAGGPTPPKHRKCDDGGTQPSHSFKFQPSSMENFRSPIPQMVTSPRREQYGGDSGFPTHVVDGNSVLPLTHTVSFYRRQQQNSANSTPVHKVSRQPPVEEEEVDDCDEQEQQKIADRIISLREEVNKQEMIISQTSRALTLCHSTREFTGSTEQVEAERVLLLATHRRQAALHEMERLKVERSLRPRTRGGAAVVKGGLTISKIVLPLKQKYVTALAAAGGKGHHVVCLVKCGDQVLPTPLVSTVATKGKNSDLDLNVPGKVALTNVYEDSTVTVEVYCLQAQEEMLSHELKYHINTKKGSAKLTPKKSKQDNRLVTPLKESPAGPHAVRSPTFALMGYVVLSPQAGTKKYWTLNNTPSMSPLEGTIEMCISCEVSTCVEIRGFLSMYEDISGFGAWHRRWCVLRGHTFNYWKYPDDERKVPPIDSISLKSCVTQHVGPMSREVCARKNTFLFERERMASPHDRDTLVMTRKGDRTIISHRLSADTREEMVKWCEEFNKVLVALRMWGIKQ